MNNKFTIALLPGDGIGPEVIQEAVKVLRVLEKSEGLELTLNEVPVGGEAYEKEGQPLPENTLKVAKKSAVLRSGPFFCFNLKARTIFNRALELKCTPNFSI